MDDWIKYLIIVFEIPRLIKFSVNLATVYWSIMTAKYVLKIATNNKLKQLKWFFIEHNCKIFIYEYFESLEKCLNSYFSC